MQVDAFVMNWMQHALMLCRLLPEDTTCTSMHKVILLYTASVVLYCVELGCAALTMLRNDTNRRSLHIMVWYVHTSAILVKVL